MAQTSEELWQAYDEQGRPVTAAGLTKLDAGKGALHGAVHVWMWRIQDDGVEILLQERAKSKLTWPGFLDISAAGHIDFGETPLQTALRETKEELGFDVPPNELRLLFVHRQNITDKTSGIIENEFQWVYGLELSGQEAQFVHEDGEVDSTQWLGLGEFKNLTAGKVADQQIVPHGDEYFAVLLKEIQRA